MAPEVPAPRTAGRYRIAVVCLGNICRSPMAHVVLRDRVAAAGLADAIEVLSAGTGDWHVGSPMDERAAAVLTEEGYDASTHRAQQIPASWLDECDLVLAMDRQNLRDIAALGPAEPGRLLMFRAFDPEQPGADVPDPYYGGDEGFHEVLAMVERTADALVSRFDAALGSSASNRDRPGS